MNPEGYHFSHPHHRFYLYNWSYTYYWRCCLCNQLITSGEEYYKCEGYCFNVVHKQCGELPEQINNHTFHDQHPLTLRIHNNNISSCCFYCDKSFGDEYAYSCEECEFYMHMRCAAIPLPTLTCHDGDIIVRFSCHQHPMAIFDQDDGKDAYQDDYHIHKLTLVDSLNEEEFEEYYCDSCEEERNPQFRVYTCTDCKYTAHVHCMMNEIMKAIKGETNTNNYVESMAFGESRWDWTIYEKAKQHQHQTLQGIIKTLTLEEKHKLTYPLDFTHFKHHYNYFRNLNSQFDELGSLENFKKFKEFLQSDYDLFWRELIWYTSEEGLKVEDEKYLRQEVVEVAEGKYMVPKTLAPILTTFILKYGDVDHGKSHLTSIGMRSVIPTLLCIVIDKMCRTKLEDITMDHLKQWYFYLHGIQEISGFKLFPIRKILYGKFLRAYLGYKVIRWEEEIPKKLDTKIATLKAELERCEKMREELPAILSDKSSFKLECLRETATWKNKTPVDAMF
ncbi:uncharacterized protein LOC115724597 isoform X2 [Cannabis sativa]|uniref:uncharacterized protein LOC115724597 isoform X2 n=1 Tax=Cannabis sativa TaxID=3483 RepID=UPI0029CA78AE|nr:uncharacterized protein LOC115724597 isoform X2 [Cannabis sativa]